MRFRLQVHFELIVLFLILLERLTAFIKLLFLHDNVLVEQLGLLRLLIDLNLGHEDLPRVVDEVSHGLARLLIALVQVLDRVALAFRASAGEEPTLLSACELRAASIRKMLIGRDKCFFIVPDGPDRVAFDHLRLVAVENVDFVPVSRCLRRPDARPFLLVSIAE